MKKRTAVLVASVLASVIAGTAQAALESRLGGQAAYDTVLDITWVTNASLSGLNSWDNQVAWASNLNYLGFDDWRLASVSALPITRSAPNCQNDSELACRDNELGYMFYYNIGASNGDNLTGNQTVGDVTLTNITNVIWSGTEWDSDDAWSYWFAYGGTGNSFKQAPFPGWAVRDGDVSPVPIPAAAWLFGSGIIGLLGWSRRK